MARLKPFVAKELGSVRKQVRHDPFPRVGRELCLLEGYSVLGDRFVSRFPDQCHIASIGSLEPP